MAELFEKFRNYVKKDMPSQSIVALGSVISSVASIIGAIIFFFDYTCSNDGEFPWFGILIVVGSLTPFLFNLLLLMENQAGKDGPGKWVGSMLALVLFALGWFAVLFLMAQACF